MNLNLDLSVVTRLFNGLLNELRQKRLWPVAAVLVAAIVAVPVVLSKSSTPAPQPSTPAPTPTPATGTALPALNVQATPGHSALVGHARNPFAAAAGASSPATTTATASAAGAVSSVASAATSAVSSLGGSGSTSSGSGGTSSSSASGGSTSGGSSSTTPPSITGNAKPKPIQSGLKSTQAYDVALSITNSAGGVDAVDPLVRLSVMPNAQQPRLVELGVLQGGGRVLFAVQPGTVVEGPGSCIPGPLDCEILSLAQDQTELVSSRTGTVGASPEALFAVTSISVTNYSSAASASRARRAESAAGRALLNQSASPTLSLFHYEPSLGSIVDLRNLTVGG